MILGAMALALMFLASMAAPTTAAADLPDFVAGTLRGPHEGGAPIREGESVTFGLWVTNGGANTTNASPVSVRFSMDNVTMGSSPLARLVAQGRMIVRSPSWTATPGQHQLRAIVDSNGDVVEAAENNNGATLGFSVQGKNDPVVVTDASDYQIVKISKYDSCFGWDSIVYTGGSMTITAEVRYTGYPVDDRQTVPVTILVDGETVLERAVELPYDERVNVTAESRGLEERGSHGYGAVVNADANGDPYFYNDFQTGMVNVDTFGRPCNPTATRTTETTLSTTSTTPTPTSPPTSRTTTGSGTTATSEPVPAPELLAFLAVVAIIAALRRLT